MLLKKLVSYHPPALYGQFLSHWAIGPGTTHADPKRLEGMYESVIDGCWLEAAMEHAVGTLGVATVAIVTPIRLLHKGPEAWGIALLRQQVARSLPAKDIPRWVTPRGALVSLIARQKVEE